MGEILIKNGCVIDGTGNPWFKADVLIKKGKIVAVGRRLRQRRASKVVYAEGLVVSPGFIDIHNHGDLDILEFPMAENLLRQGVTTVVFGNCGTSPAPINSQAKELLGDEAIQLEWTDFAGFLKRLEATGIAVNVASLVGHGTIRAAVMGMDDRFPTTEELAAMKDLLYQSLRDGAFGMSLGLLYPPGAYSELQELVELAKVVAELGGILATHIRNESDTLLEAVNEVLTIAEEARVPLEISHLKSSGKMNWGRVSTALRLIEEAREKGIEVTCDVYPYTAGCLDLTALLPSWALVGGLGKMLQRLKDPEVRHAIRKDIEWGAFEGDNFIKSIGWENIIINDSPKHREYEGKSFAALAEETGRDPYEIMFDLLIKDEGKTTLITFEMSEKDVIQVLSHPLSMIGSDGEIQNPNSRKRPHPRTYGTFARVFAQYVRKGILRPEEAVRKMSSFPAQKLGLTDRGLIAEGLKADLVIFDLEKFQDEATYAEPQRYAKGVKYVFVNGEPVIENGIMTGLTPGQVLRKDNSHHRESKW